LSCHFATAGPVRSVLIVAFTLLAIVFGRRSETIARSAGE
jgi:hypothetical protein